MPVRILFGYVGLNGTRSCLHGGAKTGPLCFLRLVTLAVGLLIRSAPNLAQISVILFLFILYVDNELSMIYTVSKNRTIVTLSNKCNNPGSISTNFNTTNRHIVST